MTRLRAYILRCMKDALSDPYAAPPDIFYYRGSMRVGSRSESLQKEKNLYKQEWILDCADRLVKYGKGLPAVTVKRLRETLTKDPFRGERFPYCHGPVDVVEALNKNPECTWANMVFASLEEWIARDENELSKNLNKAVCTLIRDCYVCKGECDSVDPVWTTSTAAVYYDMQSSRFLMMETPPNEYYLNEFTTLIYTQSDINKRIMADNHDALSRRRVSKHPEEWLLRAAPLYNPDVIRKMYFTPIKVECPWSEGKSIRYYVFSRNKVRETINGKTLHLINGWASTPEEAKEEVRRLTQDRTDDLFARYAQDMNYLFTEDRRNGVWGEPRQEPSIPALYYQIA